MALEKEIATYKRLLPTLEAEEGKFILIKGEELVGIFESYENALRDGYKKFSLDGFMVKEIRQIEPIHCIQGLRGYSHSFP